MADSITPEFIENELRASDGTLPAEKTGTDTDPVDDKKEEATVTGTESYDPEVDADDESDVEDDDSDSDEEEEDQDEDSDESDDEKSDAGEKGTKKPEKSETQKSQEKEETESVKEIKRRLIPQVNKKSLEAEAAKSIVAKLMSEKGKPTSYEEVQAVVAAEIAQFEARREAIREEKIFFRKFPDVAEYKAELKVIREAHPSLTLEAARKLYLAEMNPSALSGEKTQGKKDAFPSNAHARKEAVTKDPSKMDNTQLTTAAMAEFQKLLGK